MRGQFCPIPRQRYRAAAQAEVPGQATDLLSSCQVPDPDGAQTARDEPGMARHEMNSLNCIVVVFMLVNETPLLLPTGHVPQSHGLIVAGRSQRFAVVGKSDTGNLFFMRVKPVEDFRRRGIPENEPENRPRR